MSSAAYLPDRVRPDSLRTSGEWFEKMERLRSGLAEGCSDGQPAPSRQPRRLFPARSLAKGGPSARPRQPDAARIFLAPKPMPFIAVGQEARIGTANHFLFFRGWRTNRLWDDGRGSPDREGGKLAEPRPVRFGQPGVAALDRGIFKVSPVRALR